jgi:diadenosine tetraphosphate (Ap4A) HIT family hydrolase
MTLMSIDQSPVADCPFCRSNGLLKSEVIAESEGAYMIPALQSPGCYLIIPTGHAETIADLPDTWWRDIKALLPKVPELTASYNLSFNIGAEAGQTVKHLHLWVIPRPAHTPSSGKGLARLLSEANKE